MEISEKETNGASPDHAASDGRQALVAGAMVRGEEALEKILAEYSVSEEEFTKWVLDGRFSEYAQALARGLAEANAPYIWAVLVEEAKQGKVPAIRLYFDVWAKNHSAGGGLSSVDGSPAPEIQALRDALFGEDS